MWFAARLLWDGAYRDEERPAVATEIAARMPQVRRTLGGTQAPSSRADASIAPLDLGAAADSPLPASGTPSAPARVVRLDAQHPRVA